MAGTHAAANAALNLALGARIQVFWPLDVAWYTGTITSLEGMRGMVEYDDGDIEELNLMNEKVRLLGIALGGPVDMDEGDGSRPKQHKPSTPFGVGTAGVDGKAAGASPCETHSPANGAERLLVRFANPNVGGRGENGDAEAGKAHPGAGHAGGGRAHGHTGASCGRAGAGMAPPRSHKAGAGGAAGGGGGARSDRGATADGARALVGFADKGPTWSSQPYGPSDAAAVRNWLAQRGMGKYASLFEANEVDMATLPYLTLQDLRELPILAVGPRRKLLASLERM